ncbi:hypothetical protein Q3G72_008982 [Acer saccharum]|nr:hypothetical protein Q3G72_008982 [Acer saccharum]
MAVNSFSLFLPSSIDWLLDSGWSLWLFGRQVLQLHSYGRPEDIPLTRFNKAGTTERAKASLRFGARSVLDLTEKEKMELDMELARLIREDVFDFLRKKNS